MCAEPCVLVCRLREGCAHRGAGSQRGRLTEVGSQRGRLTKAGSKGQARREEQAHRERLRERWTQRGVGSWRDRLIEREAHSESNGAMHGPRGYQAQRETGSERSLATPLATPLTLST